jgi:hypothetical protein
MVYLKKVEIVQCVTVLNFSGHFEIKTYPEVNGHNTKLIAVNYEQA